MTKEQLAKYKSGGRNSGSDSDYSYRSVYSPGGTRRVRRRRRRSDGNYSDSESYDSEKDLSGKERRLQRRLQREEREQQMQQEMAQAREILNSAHSYYSYVSDGGTRHVKRRKRHEDGTYSDSESCDEDMLEHYEDIKKAKEILGEDIDGSKKRHWKKKRKDIADDLEAKLSSDGSSSPDRLSMARDVAEDVTRTYSVISDVSEGGTRRRYRRKVLRDDDGNVIGFGSPELMSPGESDEESVRIRRDHHHSSSIIIIIAIIIIIIIIIIKNNTTTTIIIIIVIAIVIVIYSYCR
ncbi:uncharacterized protein [Haliotis asinina]|uniref:uncharacterized protein n=1 Tax=Haliotis asinina TaxID=109174 RepID=UPI0035324D5C